MSLLQNYAQAPNSDFAIVFSVLNYKSLKKNVS